MKTTSDAEGQRDEQLAYSPKQFAELFGKHQTWAYRQLYRGTVRAITKYGRILIPRSEAKRLLDSAHEYGREESKNTR